jgi:hypothetical protein
MQVFHIGGGRVGAVSPVAMNSSVKGLLNVLSYSTQSTAKNTTIIQKLASNSTKLGSYLINFSDGSCF